MPHSALTPYAGALIAGLALAAPAAAATFTLGDGTDSLGTIPLTASGITMTVTALKDGLSSGSIDIHRNTNGWGVRTNPAGNALGASATQVEAFALVFSEPVLLQSFSLFERGTGSGEMVLAQTLAGPALATLTDADGGGATLNDVSASGFVGTSFFLLGSTLNNGARLTQVVVAPAPVPLPAGILLLASAAGALALRRRRAD